MKRNVGTREQVVATREPLRQQLGERLSDLMLSLRLEDGYDWDIDDGDGLSNLSTVVLRSTDLFSPDLVVGLARCLHNLKWELFVAEDAPSIRSARPIAMIFRWGAGPVQQTPREQAILDEANATLKKETTSCSSEGE